MFGPNDKDDKDDEDDKEDGLDSYEPPARDNFPDAAGYRGGGNSYGEEK